MTDKQARTYKLSAEARTRLQRIRDANVGLTSDTAVIEFALAHLEKSLIDGGELRTSQKPKKK